MSSGSATWDPIKKAAWKADYYSRPEVKQRKAEQMRASAARNKAKHAARRKVRTEIEMGRLVRQPCGKCGAPEAHAHHDDYSQPLAVRWLCRPHHDAEHKAEGR